MERVELSETNLQYALIKDQRRIENTVYLQGLAPYPRKDVQNLGDVQVQDFDELAIDATNSYPTVLTPKLSLPGNISRSSKSNNQDVNFNESFQPTTNKIKDNEQSFEHFKVRY